MISLRDLNWALAYARGSTKYHGTPERKRYDAIITQFGIFNKIWSDDIIVIQNKIKERREKINKLLQILKND